MATELACVAGCSAPISMCGRTQGGANSGLRAYGIAQVVEAPQAKKSTAAGEAKAVLKRFWRPEEVSRDARLQG